MAQLQQVVSAAKHPLSKYEELKEMIIAFDEAETGNVDKRLHSPFVR